MVVTKLTKTWFTLFVSILSITSLKADVTFSCKNLNEKTEQITCNISLKPHDFVYKDYINFSVDHPDIKLSDWHTSIDATSYYDPTFKETKKIFNKDFTITVDATCQTNDIDDAHLYFTYYQYSQKKITQKLLPLSFNTTPIAKTQSQIQNTKTVPSHNVNTYAESNVTTQEKKLSWSEYISALVQKSDSVWIRLLLVLLLGMLLSLTPCVYPMIPITVGILQSQGSSSVWKNFLVALSYTMGIASTFALLGLSAAFTGQLFGSLMTNPIVIICIVILMVYLAGSMLGLYDMYIPRALQSNNTSVKGGSYTSAFLFGAASGTVASPCLSPGLVLLLSLVTTLGSKLMGFALLFSFGVGLGIPLLIIGTFSGSLNMLPRAGMWMVEIKQLFGFIMLAMCFYFLSNIIPWHILSWAIALFVFGIGIFYLSSVKKNTPPLWKYTKNIFGMVMIASSVFVFAKSYQALYMHKKSVHEDLWLCEYNDAINKAKSEGKHVFLDVGAPFCSICKAIDKKLLCHNTVAESLKNFVPVKIDGSDTAHEDLRQKFNIMGVPAFIIINPFDEQPVKRWGGELYEVAANDFVEELKIYANKPV